MGVLTVINTFGHRPLLEHTLGPTFLITMYSNAATPTLLQALKLDTPLDHAKL